MYRAGKTKNKITEEYLKKEYSIKKRTIEEISKEFECSPQAIWYYLKKYKISTVCHYEEYENFYGEISSAYWGNIKRHARERELDFSITIQEVWNLFLKQNEKCAFSGIKLTLFKDRYKTQTASLDRINPNKGYTIDNIQWIHKKLNRMKWDLTNERFLFWIKIINNFQKNKIINNKILDKYEKHQINSIFWEIIKHGAKRRNLEFKITKNFAWLKMIEQNFRCALSNEILIFYGKKIEHTKQTASIDRIDSNFGYLSNNIQWVHREINKMKMNMEESDFFKWIERIYDYKKL